MKLAGQNIRVGEIVSVEQWPSRSSVDLTFHRLATPAENPGVPGLEKQRSPISGCQRQNGLTLRNRSSACRPSADESTLLAKPRHDRLFPQIGSETALQLSTVGRLGN
jgi:hypothetical protein